jgi:hypothetical protein
MSKTRLIFMSILAVFALSAVSSAAASAAPQYFVGGAAFAGEESVNAQLMSGTTAVLVSKLTGGATIEIVCKATKLTSAVIKENNKGSAKAIVYEKCAVKLPAACKVSETLTTSEVVAEATDGVGLTAVNVTFSPKEKPGPFISINVTGCSGEGKYNVTGTAECEEAEPAVEAVNKTCKFTSASGSSLKFGTSSATLTEEPDFFFTGHPGTEWVIKH